MSETINKSLELYTDYMNHIIDLNSKINSCKDLNIETPKHIEDLLEKMNISANFLIISSECVTIGKSFNESDSYLYKIFYVKSIFRIVFETDRLINKYGKLIFLEKSIKASKIKENYKKFKKLYPLKEIKEIRNNLSAHYTDDFKNHINLMLAIDIEKSLKMYFDFINIIFELTNYVIKDWKDVGKINLEFKTYFNTVQEKLKPK